jgi:hypothetical protein
MYVTMGDLVARWRLRHHFAFFFFLKKSKASKQTNKQENLQFSRHVGQRWQKLLRGESSSG